MDLTAPPTSPPRTRRGDVAPSSVGGRAAVVVAPDHLGPRDFPHWRLRVRDRGEPGRSGTPLPPRRVAPPHGGRAGQLPRAPLRPPAGPARAVDRAVDLSRRLAASGLVTRVYRPATVALAAIVLTETIR